MKLHLFGKYMTDPEGTDDIDLVYAGDQWDTRSTQANVLRELKKVAIEVGKPVDVFIDPDEETVCKTATFDPKKGQWAVEERFVPKGFFRDAPHRELHSVWQLLAKPRVVFQIDAMVWRDDGEEDLGSVEVDTVEAVLDYVKETLADMDKDKDFCSHVTFDIERWLEAPQ